MPIKLTFLGGAQNVTGFKCLLETGSTRLLVDCGLFQERAFQSKNWGQFPVSPESIDAVLVSHAHVDHSGYLPKLVRDGFKGPIYCTTATAEIVEIILLDAAHLLEEDAEFKRKRHQREGRKGPYPDIPLYTTGDAEAVFPLFSRVEYRQPVLIGDGVTVMFHDAGHVLGSAMIKIAFQQGDETITVLFSGDIGARNKPIIHNPTVFDEADYVVMESTYGDRLHESHKDLEDTLCNIVKETWQAGGNLLIPSFALERSQEVLYHLNNLLLNDCVPHLMVFLDSPMAARITEVFRRHSELFDDEMKSLMSNDKSPFDFPSLKMVQTIDDSKAINHIRGTVIIIAGSGMCTGGRIKHHLVNNITRPESTVLFVGYQAGGTLGRQILDGNKMVRILGQTYPVKARIVQLHGFSAHADRNELFRWVSNLKKAPKQVFIAHGEAEAARSFADLVRAKTGWEVSVPGYLDEAILK